MKIRKKRLCVALIALSLIVVMMIKFPILIGVWFMCAEITANWDKYSSEPQIRKRDPVLHTWIGWPLLIVVNKGWLE